MRILHVDHSPIFGGAERSVAELARAQRELSHDVAVAVGQQGEFSSRLTRLNIPWYDLGWASRYVEAPSTSTVSRSLVAAVDFVRAGRSFRRLVNAIRPDVVQVHTRKAQVVAAFSGRPNGSMMIFHMREAPPERAPLRAVVKSALRRADHAVALSRWIVDAYVGIGAIPRSGRFGQVPSGVDVGQFAGLDTPWLDGRRRPVIGYVGHLAKRKAPHLLIEVAEQLADLDVEFRIFGSVWFAAAERRYGRWLEARLARSPARGRVRHSAAVPDPVDAFREIDVLVHTSVLPEAFGRVIVEAMAARRPIIAFPLGPLPEILDESCGVFAAAPTSTAIAEALRYLLSDRDRAREFAENAARRAATFAPDRVARAMDEEYQRMGLLGVKRVS